MNLDWKKIAIALGSALVVIIIIVLIIRLRGGEAPPSTGGTFGTTGGAVQIPVGQDGANAGSLPTFASGGGTQLPPIFKIADGPVVGAMLIETSRPTTTIARYVTGGDGHVLDMPLDVPGAAARLVSNTTIPGVVRTIWTEKGNGVIVQYLSGGITKSAHLSLLSATTTAASGAAPASVTIRFLLDNITDIASSPDGASIAYLLRNAGGGTDGYTAKTDGSGTKKLFSLPLTQLVLSWPAPNTIFLYTKSASGIPGIAFFVQAKTGAVTPALYGLGLTASADQTGSNLLYRTDDGARATLFTMRLPQGNASAVVSPSSLSSPLPEQCVWYSPQGSSASTTTAYCASVVGLSPSGYLDLWHRGEASFSNALVSINPATGILTPLATPGTRDGGEISDIVDLSVSKSGRYLSFISKDDKALWGARLK